MHNEWNMVLELGDVSQRSFEQKQSLGRQLWPRDTTALERRNQRGSPRSLGYHLVQVLGTDECSFRGMPAGRKTGGVGLRNTAKWPGMLLQLSSTCKRFRCYLMIPVRPSCFYEETVFSSVLFSPTQLVLKPTCWNCISL